jgi:endonuclease YncB( thermonuclease family)
MFAKRSSPHRLPYPQERISFEATTGADQRLLAKVIRVLDGDTVDVSTSEGIIRIRLDAIDCPEDGQPWSGVARAGLIKLIGGREIVLETYGIDVHGRTLATIYVPNESKLMNVNERMVVLGHAWVLRLYYGHLSLDRREKLNQLETWAKSNRVGLWKANAPVAPWEWRKQTRKASA